ncbi:MAG: hypothetical protein LUE98_14280 [Tannerellaceae bacterium]|nr:hypothetical protein [Tannerellaceae bacterium]
MPSYWHSGATCMALECHYYWHCSATCMAQQCLRGIIYYFSGEVLVVDGEDSDHRCVFSI